MTGSMVLLDVTLSANEGASGEMTALLRETQAASRAEPGCIAYRFSVDLDDPCRFYAFELWADAAAFRAHMAAAGFRAFVAALPRCGRLVSSDRRTGVLVPYVAGSSGDAGA